MLNKTFLFVFVASLLLSSYLYFCLNSKDIELKEAKKDLAIKTYENSICNANLSLQNKAIESLRVEIKPSEAVKEQIKKIKSVEIGEPHNSGDFSRVATARQSLAGAKTLQACEAKVEAYEALFNASF